MARERSDPMAIPADEPDFAVLYTREAPRLLRFFRYRIGPADDSADLVQESFLRLFRSSITPALDNPAAYLHQIARNLLFDRTRSRKRCREVFVDEAFDIEHIAVPATQQSGLEVDELMNRYQLAIDALPPRTREVFLLHRVDDLTYKEIAARLGIGARTVEWHIAEALVRIRRLLDEE